MNKVLLGLPNGGSVKTKTMVSVVRNILRNAEILDFFPVAGALGPENRNALAEHAVEHDYTHLWLVDADMWFHDDALAKLLAHDLDIVGLPYNRRGLPLETTVRIQDEHGVVGVPTGPMPKDVFACYATGSGCQLVKVSALRRIPKPWFSTAYSDEGKFMDDAVWFGQQAARAGIQVCCDPTIWCQHIGDYDY